MKKYYPGYMEIPDNKNIIIEHTLKYGDIDEIKQIFSQYGIPKCKDVWIKNVLSDSRLKKLNYFLAKYFFYPTVDPDTLRKLLNPDNQKRSNRIIDVSDK